VNVFLKIKLNKYYYSIAGYTFKEAWVLCGGKRSKELCGGFSSSNSFNKKSSPLLPRRLT